MNLATQSKSDLKSLINSEAVKAQIARALPSHMTPDRFTRVLTTMLLRTPKLAQCDQTSFMKAMLDCSAIGLEPDGRRAHLIPFENRKLGIVECQLIVDYKGLIELAKRSGEVATWEAFTVCEKDIFSWENGKVTHRIDWLSGDRGKTLAFYSHVRTKDGEDGYEVMTLAEVNAIRARSKAASSGPWVSDFDEMGKKTVMRRHSKRLTLSPEFHDALEKDADRADEQLRQATGRVVDFTAPALPNNSQAAPETGGISSGVVAPYSHQSAAGLDSQEADGEPDFALEPETPFPQHADPYEQINWLLEAARMSEAELFEILHSAQMVPKSARTIADLDADKAAKVVKTWEAVLDSRKGAEQ